MTPLPQEREEEEENGNKEKGEIQNGVVTVKAARRRSRGREARSRLGTQGKKKG